MRYLLLLPLLLFTFTACQDKEQAQKELAARDAKIVEQVRSELQKEFSLKEKALKKAYEEKEALLKKLHANSMKNPTQNDKLNTMGVHVEEGVISIDTNKTKDFFKTLSSTMNQKMKEVNDDMEKGIIDIKNAGIQINNEHINIDLNKTKELLDLWGAKMKSFVQEIDSLAQEIDTNTTIKGN